jgi:hypothetical protein
MTRLHEDRLPLGAGTSARLRPLILADGLACIAAEAEDVAAGRSIGFYPLESNFHLQLSITSPSSLTNRPIRGLGRMPSTVSEGRHNLTPLGVTTIGRLIRIG